MTQDDTGQVRTSPFSKHWVSRRVENEGVIGRQRRTGRTGSIGRTTEKTTKADGTLGNLLKKTPVTMHVFGVDTGVGDWGNQDKETGEHKKDCFRI